MEAVGVPGGPCSQYEEEATSESNGQFRLRGLKPQVSFTNLAFLRFSFDVVFVLSY